MDSAITSPPITELLVLARNGSAEAEDALFRAVYGQLRQIAARHLRGEAKGVGIEPSELVNEAYLNLFGGSSREFENRGHFMAVAARAMRFILVDLARKRKSRKRFGGRPVTLGDLLDSPEHWSDRLLVIDDALTRLAQFDPRGAKVLELRAFVGLTVSQIATIIDKDERTVKRDHRDALIWLRAELGLPQKVNSAAANSQHDT
jgi:RNA polymerase sigma factor (TIGR02999 family)